MANFSFKKVSRRRESDMRMLANKHGLIEFGGSDVIEKNEGADVPSGQARARNGKHSTNGKAAQILRSCVDQNRVARPDFWQISRIDLWVIVRVVVAFHMRNTVLDSRAFVQIQFGTRAALCLAIKYASLYCMLFRVSLDKVSPFRKANAMVIEVKALSKSFQRPRKSARVLERLNPFSQVNETMTALESLDLSVTRGESLAFIGPNGAGKSTTIKMLTGILHPTSGEARVLGLVPWKDRIELSFRIGSVFGQKSQLWLHLPPSDTFELLSRVYELDRAKFRKRRDELVELFEVGDYVNVPVRKLSLGQRMRCEIAASLLHEPEILFLDEPTIGLDPVAKSSIRDLIRRANREAGVTVFLTSHDAGDIESLCKRTVIVNRGTVVFDGATNSLRREVLGRKEIDLKLRADIAGAGGAGGFEALEGVEVLKAKGYGLKLAVDTAKTGIDRVVGELLRRYEVEDIVIANAPLEEIIARIYTRESGRVT
jgi:ABC-2 type transport system ATP-binding protein